MKSDRIKPNDIRISGISQSSGGTFDQVLIEGVGRINGDVTCSSFVCNGRGSVNGQLRSGTAEFHGSSTVKGHLLADKTQIKGMLTVQGKLAGETVELEGQLTVKGDCEAESFTARGGVTIDGLLNADTLDIRFVRKCSARELGGGQITIRPEKVPSAIRKLIGSLSQPHLVADTIEGDRIALEGTTAEVVRGSRIEIGPDCRIARIEYKEELTVDPRSRVGSQIKL